MKIFFKLILFVSLTFLVIPSFAQAKWDLSMCIEQAMKNNSDIKRQAVQVLKQNIQVQTDKYSRLPNLVANGTEELDFGRSLNRDNAYVDVSSQTSVFSLNAEIPIFTGFNIPNTIAQHKFELKANKENLIKIGNDIKLQVASYYYQVLLNKEIYAIACEQIKLSKELEEMTKVLVNNGKAPGSQLLEVQAQVSNDELQAVQTYNTLRLSIIDLIQLMELKNSDNFDIAPIQTDSIFLLPEQPDNIYEVASQVMPEIKSATYIVESRKKAVKIAQSAYYPTISLQATINSGYYHFNGAGNVAFNDQLKINLQKTIYLTVQIPIFNRFATRNAVRMAKEDLEDSRLVAENTQKILYKQIQKAYYDAVSAREKYISTMKTTISNSEVLRIMQEKYNAGKSTVYEYNEAKVKLTNSQSNLAQAKYEFMLQKYLIDFYLRNTKE
jgi:outer membrane protein